MTKKLSSKILTPEFKEKLGDLFRNMNKSQRESISFLYYLATHDEKTGLYNNKFFENILEMEMEKAKRGQENLCLFMIDLDFFKRVNEEHGHIKADEFLKRLAMILNKLVRKSDVVARFGGEEFFILLPQTNIEKAKNLTSRIRDAIKTDKILAKNKITVSGGLVQYKKGDTKKSLKERTDRALYKAKNTGRDKFVAIE